jgi:hypothetical protein
MRERNPILANYIVQQTLGHIKSRPSIIALTGLHLLTAYLFPTQPYFANSPEVASSDDMLRFKYFTTAFEVLKSSLEETDAVLMKDNRYSQNDLRFRALYQGQVALVLAALAPRYGPQYLQELVGITTRLSGGVPPNIAAMSKFLSAQIKGDPAGTDDPNIAIAVAISNGDFDEARRLIDKLEDEVKKKAYLQMLARAEFKERLNESDFTEALNVARRIDDVNLRVTLFLQLAKASYRKDDATFSRLIISEARSALVNGDKNGMRARALLTFASEISTMAESDAVDMLHSAISVINSLPIPKAETEFSELTPAEAATAELNDPRSFVDSPDLSRAFNSLARVDFDGTLLAAARITVIPVQLVARLAASEVGLVKRIKRSVATPAKKTLMVTPANRGAKKSQ